MVILPSIRRKYMNPRIPKGATVPMSECVVALASDSVVYTGGARTVGVTVTWSGEALSVNADYTLSFANNVNVGPATVTVTGMGQFSGSVTKTFYITAAPTPAGWSGIDFAGMSTTPVNVATIQPSESLQAIRGCYVNIIPDYPGHILFGTGSNGKFFDWGFSDDDYDVSCIESVEHRKKGGLVSNAQSFTMGDDGTRMYFENGNSLLWAELPTAYDISTAVYMGGVGVTRSVIAGFMSFSSDGKKFFYKSHTGPTVYCMNLGTAYRFGSFVNEDSYNLETMFGYSSVYGMCIEPSGKNAVIGVFVGYHARLVRLSMTTPFDFSSAVVASVSGDLASNEAPVGVFLDEGGQRVVVWYGTSGNLCEYSLAS